MIYLDYASHTNTDLEIFEGMIKDSMLNNISVNSLYAGNFSSYEKYLEYENGIKELSNLMDFNFVLTSSATESNNLAIKGYCNAYKCFGKHIISTPYEHSSISGSLNRLVEEGFEVDFLELDKNGFIDLNSLKKLIRNDTILLSFASVNSETGHIQDIVSIKNIINDYPNISMHIDATQSFGKINIDYSCADLITMSAHKLYGPTSGCGGLFVKKDKIIIAQLDGGKSTTPYRSSTPDLIMIGAMYRVCKNLFTSIDNNFNHVKTLQTTLYEFAIKNNFIINSDINNPFILNFSTPKKGINVQKELALRDIFISTKSSCSSKSSIPKSVFAIFNDRKRAINSIRISLSHKTSNEEIDIFMQNMEEIISG